MPLARLLLGTALAASALAATAGGASAQPMLYEQRLPDGFAFVRIASALPGAVTVKPDFGDAVNLGAAGAERVSPYYVAEGVTGRPVRFQVSIGGRTVEAQAPVTGGGLNTILLQPSGEGVTAVPIADKAEYRQTQARVTFYNAVPGCEGGSLALVPSNQSVFSGVAPNTGTMRSLNPAAAVVKAACTGRAAPNLDVGRLQAGGLYSIWLMAPGAPGSEPVSFLVTDRIAPR